LACPVNPFLGNIKDSDQRSRNMRRINGFDTVFTLNSNGKFKASCITGLAKNKLPAKTVFHSVYARFFPGSNHGVWLDG
jgi:hypothetical protein